MSIQVAVSRLIALSAISSPPYAASRDYCVSLGLGAAFSVGVSHLEAGNLVQTGAAVAIVEIDKAAAVRAILSDLGRNIMVILNN